MGKPAKPKNKDKKDKSSGRKAASSKTAQGSKGTDEWRPKNLEDQLHLLGLWVREVAADGNCFFRAVVRAWLRATAGCQTLPVHSNTRTRIDDASAFRRTRSLGRVLHTRTLGTRSAIR